MNCKPGDMAVVVRRGVPDGSFTLGLAGRIVEVVRLAEPGEIFFSTLGAMFRISNKFPAPAWVCRSSELLPWLSGKGPNAGKIQFFRERPIADANLIPISGVPVHDEQHEEVVA